MASDSKKRKGEGLDAAVEDLVSWVAATFAPRSLMFTWKVYRHNVWRPSTSRKSDWDSPRAKGVEAEVEGNWGRIQGDVGTGRMEHFHRWDSSSMLRLRICIGELRGARGRSRGAQETADTGLLSPDQKVNPWYLWWFVRISDIFLGIILRKLAAQNREKENTEFQKVVQEQRQTQAACLRFLGLEWNRIASIEHIRHTRTHTHTDTDMQYYAISFTIAILIIYLVSRYSKIFCGTLCPKTRQAFNPIDNRGDHEWQVLLKKAMQVLAGFYNKPLESFLQEVLGRGPVMVSVSIVRSTPWPHVAARNAQSLERGQDWEREDLLGATVQDPKEPETFGSYKKAGAGNGALKLHLCVVVLVQIAWTRCISYLVCEFNADSQLPFIDRSTESFQSASFFHFEC